MRAIGYWIIAAVLAVGTMIGYKVQADDARRLEANRDDDYRACLTVSANKESCNGFESDSSYDNKGQRLLVFYLPMAGSILFAFVGLVSAGNVDPDQSERSEAQAKASGRN